ncbi:M56 family metallopeptidase [Streptomyces sp. SAI-090]|jgi:hypothetical protein|uniref:M56 family metallopeptidase n=1 Tax=Streptomyces sp. SAI-090 TaxID=2940545 RepID=UPI0024740B5F|nr:M56 family metallopeptidase [Streptomyces sp. SAI-090]MDH6522289.1 hypothetical protein [Streptomyces sp. SAI-090]
MLVLGVLLAYAVLLGSPVDRLLARSAWPARAPRAALWAWHTCALAFLTSALAALAVAAHDAWEYVVVRLFHAAEAEVHALYTGGWHVQVVADTALLLLLAAPATLAVLAVRRIVRAWRERGRHRLATDALAAPGPGRGRGRRGPLRVLEHPVPAAFCIPGSRADARIVLTRGALRLLTREQVAAVLAHERAHLRFRHHRAVLLAETVTAAVGWSGALRHYAGQVRRLTEMAADDHATRRHGRRAVASALLEMCAAGGPEAGNGAQVLPFGAADPAERIRRLLAPHAPARRMVVPLLVTGAAVVALALPVVLSLGPAASLAGTAHSATRSGP